MEFVIERTPVVGAASNYFARPINFLWCQDCYQTTIAWRDLGRKSRTSGLFFTHKRLGYVSKFSDFNYDCHTLSMTTIFLPFLPPLTATYHDITVTSTDCNSPNPLPLGSWVTVVLNVWPLRRQVKWPIWFLFVNAWPSCVDNSSAYMNKYHKKSKNV